MLACRSAIVAASVVLDNVGLWDSQEKLHEASSAQQALALLYGNLFSFKLVYVCVAAVCKFT